jgi:integrase
VLHNSRRLIMDFVEPIRDKKKLSQIKNQLEGAKRYRDLLLFVVGINTALRISDLLQLRIGDFVNEQGIIQDRFSIREEKRDKRNVVVINASIRDALEKFLMAFPDITQNVDHYVFFSTRNSKSYRNFTKPISRIQAWRLIAEMCQNVGLNGNYGNTHAPKNMGVSCSSKWCAAGTYNGKAQSQQYCHD